MNMNVMLGNMNNPMMGNMNANPMMGNMNANQMIGNINANPMMGNMNNQLMTNFAMDNTALKLKAIIDPYEKRITELEQKLKDKDFQILLLNEKLEQYKNKEMLMNSQINNMNNNINMINPNPMMVNNNVNWMDIYNNFGNNNMNIDSANMNNLNNNNALPKWNISFKYNEQEYKERCNPDDNTERTFKRFCKKIGIKFKNCKFVLGGKNVHPRLTFAQAGIGDNSTILIIKNNSINDLDDAEKESDSEDFCEDFCQCQCEGYKMNITFTTTKGSNKNIVFSLEHSIDTLLKKYLFLVGKPEIYMQKSERIGFLYNGINLKFGSKTKIKDSFNNIICPKIIVNDIDNIIIGA